MEDIGLIISIAIVLGAALVGGMIARLLKLPIILGYLFSGVIIGPHGFDLLFHALNSLSNEFNISVAAEIDNEVRTLAWIGVVLLMFTLGIEFSIKTLRKIGRIAVIGGIAQILLTIGVGISAGLLLDWSPKEALVFGFFISLSSTIIVLKTLMERGETGSPHGRVMIGILLIQDISVVPMMVFLVSLSQTEMTLSEALGWAILKAVVFLLTLVALGIWVFPWFMRRVVRRRSRELFLLAVVGLCLGAAFGADYAGLSVALGAFLVGIVISESEYAYQALADIRPLRDIFAVLFFVSLGMLADPIFIKENPVDVCIVVVVIVIGKFIITALLSRIFGYSAKTSLFVGSGLFQIGEFSFVLAAIALDTNIISEYLYSLTLAAAFITILLTPFSMGFASVVYHRLIEVRRIGKFFANTMDPATLDSEVQLVNHVVICGYGRVARNLGQVLERRHFTYVVIDIDPRVIDMAHEKEIPCIYGDASNPDILIRARLEKAKVLVIAMPDPAAARLVAANARRINPRLDIVARVHREEDVKIMTSIGVSEIVKPELEAGLEIIRHTLRRFGLTTQETQYIINTLREENVQSQT